MFRITHLDARTGEIGNDRQLLGRSWATLPTVSKPEKAWRIGRAVPDMIYKSANGSGGHAHLCHYMTRLVDLVRAGHRSIVPSGGRFS
ncbi:MAG: hypothetical protein ACLQPD_02440 [Desulfomonilaceae bacterium]